MNAERLKRGLYWDRAWSLVSGCSPASEGCRNCWAASEAHTRGGQANAKIRARYAGLTTAAGKWTGEVREMEASLGLPLRTRKPQVWALWTDLFHPKVSSEFRDKAFAIMARCPQHVFLVLTKRAAIMWAYMDFEDRTITRRGRVQNQMDFATAKADRPRIAISQWPLPNVWLGVTVEHPNQGARIRELLSTPAAYRWISAEPLMGLVNLVPYLFIPDHHGAPADLMPSRGIDLVIAGGESGKGARPCRPDWARGLRDQCASAGVPFVWKQWGPRGAGRLIDGSEHMELPW